METRPVKKSQRSWLQKEVSFWQSNNLIQPEQASSILSLYRSEEEEAQVTQHHMVLALVSLASLLVGLAILLVIGHNWQEIPDPIKLGIILTTLAFAHGLGWLLKFKLDRPMLAEAVFFLACLAYGGAIGLVAQVFHLNTNFPNGMLLWALGVLPVALAMNSLPIYMLYAVLLTIWSTSEISAGASFRTPDSNVWFFPQGAFLLPVLALPGLLWAYRRSSLSGVSIFLIPLVIWSIQQPWAWGCMDHFPVWAGCVGAILLVLAEVHGPRNLFGIPYRVLGAVLSVSALIPLGSNQFTLSMLRPNQAFGMPSIFQIVGGLIVLACLVGSLASIVPLRFSNSTETRHRPGRELVPTGLAAVMVVISFASALFPSLPDLRIVTIVLANAAILALSIYLMWTGTQQERLRPFAGGIGIFLIWCTARYIDLYDELGMLGGAGLFLVCAACLGLLARFWSRVRASGPKISESEPDRMARAWTSPRFEHLLPRLLVPALAVGVLFQFTSLFGMIGWHSVPRYTGTPVLLRTVPVDPRDLLRGDYVVLSYPFSIYPPGGISGMTKQAWDRSQAGTQVFVSLEPEGDGKHHRAGTVSLTPPPTGLYLAGTITPNSTLEFGIESFFVPEGTGKKWEQANRSNRLSAEILVTPSGRGQLQRLQVEAP